MFNMDLNKKVIIHAWSEEWINSPAIGIKRIFLEREGTESGRATSIVEYKPEATFSSHVHPLGEEIFVLEGIFSDEYGNYGPGTYIRNPPGSGHTPFSKEGCKIFVKLNAMNSEDQERVVIDTHKSIWHEGYGKLKVMPLHNFCNENVALVKWPKGAKFTRHSHWGGEEILVLNGAFIDEHGYYPVGSWIRSPHLSTHDPYVEEETIILVKTGHL
jgi:anti-sigma factor ChrR (cupin superfamily)